MTDFSQTNNGEGGFRSLLNSLTGKRSTSFRMALVMLSLLSIGTAFSDLKQDISQQVTWGGIAFQSFLLSAAYFAALGFLIDLTFPNRGIPRFVALIVLFGTTEMFRALFVGSVAVNLEVSPSLNIPHRAFAGAFTGMIMFSISAIVINDSSEYRNTKARLFNLQSELSAALTNAQSGLNAQRALLISKVQESVTNAVQAISVRAEANREPLHEVVTSILETSQAIVRPLSHELFDYTVELNVEHTLPRISLSRVVNLTTVIRPFRPVVSMVIGFFLTLGAALFAVGDPIPGLIGLVGLILWVGAILWFLQVTLTKRLPGFRLSTRILVISLIWLLITLGPVTIIIVVGDLDFVNDFPFVLYSIAIGQVMGWALACYPGLLAARAEVLSDISETSQKLRWARARLGAQMWSEQINIAKALHKDVQGGLIASAMRMHNDVAAGKETAKVLAKLREDLETVTQFAYNTSGVLDLREGLSQIVETWRGVIDISLNFSPSMEARINMDEVARRVILDLVAEFIINSIKHGKASRADIICNETTHNSLKLVMTNNGRPIIEPVNIGMGKRMVEAQTMSTSWSNLPREAGIRVSAEIALEQQK